MNFYPCNIENILTNCITVWYSNCTVSDKKALQRVVKTAQYITCVQLPSIKDIHYKHWTITCPHCMFTMFIIMLPVFAHFFVLLPHNAICIVYHTYVVYIYIHSVFLYLFCIMHLLCLYIFICTFYLQLLVQMVSASVPQTLYSINILYIHTFLYITVYLYTYCYLLLLLVRC